MISTIKSTLIRHRFRVFMAVLFTAFLTAAGCSSNDSGTNPQPQAANNGNGSTGGNTNTAQVAMQNMAFVPANITVAAGTTVTWTNKDPYQHTVTSGTPGAPDGKFDSGLIGQNATFSYKFDTKGTYSYYCKPHQQVMKGTVTVQ